MYFDNSHISCQLYLNYILNWIKSFHVSSLRDFYGDISLSLSCGQILYYFGSLEYQASCKMRGDAELRGTGWHLLILLLDGTDVIT